MRFDEALKSFDLHLKAAGLAENSRASYARTLRKFETFLETSDRETEIEQLKKEDVIGFLAACEDAGEKRSSVILRLVICKKFFGWLRSGKRISEDPTAGIPVPKQPRRIPQYVSPSQIEDLLSRIDAKTPCGSRNRALAELLYSTGLRISEALSLELGDVDADQGFVYVRNGKGGKARSVPIGATAVLWLEQYLAEGRRKLETDCSSLVFLSRSGKPLTRQSAAKAIRATARLAGLPSWFSPHALRHACATHMLEGGAGVAHISEQLGHSRLNSTMIYMAVRPERLKIVHTSSHPRG